MTQAVDVDAYFKRIAYGGSRAPTLETLRELVRLHTQTIPFENLNPLARLPVDLSPAALQRKLIGERRGGYCYEQNSLLSNVLRQLGYRIVELAARIVWSRPPDAPVLPRTHMLLRVELQGESHIVDVGFGGMTLTGVLRLVPDIEQATPHNPFRLVRQGETFTMQASVRSEWCSIYRFDLQEQTSADYELLNWYSSTHPNSRFLIDLIAARTTDDRRYALCNKHFTVHHLDGLSERHVVASVRELYELLEDVFLLRAPDSERLDAEVKRIFQST